jgi:hypothetical protein
METKLNPKAKPLRATRQTRRLRNPDGVSITTEKRFENRKLVLFKNIVPDRVMTRLKYLVNRTLVNNGINTATIQLRANGMFDVDPSLASPSVLGFPELSALYGKNKVYAVNQKCTFCNRETNPVMVCLGFDTNPYSNKLLANFENANSKVVMLPAGPSAVPKTLQIRRTAEQVIGDETVLTDAGYSGTSLANPSFLWYCSIAGDLSYLGSVFTLQGVAVSYEIEFDVEFYERKNLSA